MKKIILTASFAFALTAMYAQEAQISALEAAIKTNTNVSTALKSLDTAVNGKINTIDPSLASKYYFLKGKAALASKDMATASDSFTKLSEIENGVFEVKNKDTKEKEYYFSQAELDKALANGKYSKPKSKSVATSYSDQVSNSINAVIDQTSKEASEAYNNKDYNTAAEKFIQTYGLQKSAGKDNKDFLYYAAVAYQIDKQLDKAAPIYENLIKEGYNGVKTTYYATNVAGNQKNNFPDKETWDSYQKDIVNSKLYKDWGQETSKDITKDLYTYAASVNYELKNNDRAIEIAKEGLKKFQGDSTLQSILTNTMHASGDSAGYINELKKAISENPNDANSLYNLGVMLSGDDASASNLIEAEKYFKKTLDLNPNNTNASLNLAALLIKEDSSLVKQMNAITGTSAADNARYEALLSNRKAIHTKALPYLEQVAKAQPNDVSILRNLSISYGILGMDAKKAQVKQQINALK